MNKKLSLISTILACIVAVLSIAKYLKEKGQAKKKEKTRIENLEMDISSIRSSTSKNLDSIRRNSQNNTYLNDFGKWARNTLTEIPSHDLINLETLPFSLTKVEIEDLKNI